MRNQNVAPMLLRFPKWLKAAIAEKAKLETERKGREVAMNTLYVDLVVAGIDLEKSRGDPDWPTIIEEFWPKK